MIFFISPWGKQAECARADAAEQALKNQGEEQETLQKARVFMVFFSSDLRGMNQQQVQWSEVLACCWLLKS